MHALRWLLMGSVVYISSVACCTELWALIMDAGTGFAAQVCHAMQYIADTFHLILPRHTHAMLSSLSAQSGPVLVRLPEYDLIINYVKQLTACAGFHFLRLWKGQEYNSSLRHMMSHERMSSAEHNEHLLLAYQTVLLAFPGSHCNC